MNLIDLVCFSGNLQFYLFIIRFGVGRYQYLPTTPRSQPTNQQSKFDCEAKRKNKALKAKGEALFIIFTKFIQKKNSLIERRKNEEKRWCLLQVYYYFENIQCKIKITWFNQSKINKDKLIERKGLNYNTYNTVQAARKEYTIETISK